MQVAGAEKGMRLTAQPVVELVEGDQVVPSGQDGIGAPPRPAPVGGLPAARLRRTSRRVPGI